MVDANATYYIARKPHLLRRFGEYARRWRDVLCQEYGAGPADAVLQTARTVFEALIPQIPYIGGDENHLTGSLLSSVICLALYRATQAAGHSAAETGRALYQAIKTHPEDYALQVPLGQRLSRDELMARRRQRAARSQERRYAGDFVYTFLEGDGETFDYGYDFSACATEQFYRAQGAADFLPYYCFTDFIACELGGLGLVRTTTLGEGGKSCDFRFTEGGRSTQHWPPPFLPDEERQT